MIQAELIRDIKSSHELVRCVAVDEESTVGSGWIEASSHVTKLLNHNCKEPKELILFSGGAYQCTFNDKQKQFSSSQLAFLLDLKTVMASLNRLMGRWLLFCMVMTDSNGQAAPPPPPQFWRAPRASRC